jgi:hypothetical protein
MITTLKQKAISFVVVALFALNASGIGMLTQTSLAAGHSGVQIACPTANGSGGCYTNSQEMGRSFRLQKQLNIEGYVTEALR